MHKVIKKINNKSFTYKLGYDVWNNKIYPKIEIYKNNKLFSDGCWGDVISINEGLFYFYAVTSSSLYSNGTVDTIKELFMELRGYSEVPDNIETEYEKIFLLYKLNDFKEL